MENFTDRPKRSDPAIIKLATSDFAQFLAKEWQEGGIDKAAWEDILTKASAFTSRLANGYEMARKVEPYFKARIDSQLVELLDEAYYYLVCAHEDAVKQWVKLHNLTLSRSIGEHVLTSRGKGKITELEPSMARYVVTPDDDPKFARGGGWVVEAELCYDPES